MLVEDIRLLFDYNAWANARILDAAARLPVEVFTTASLGARSLEETLRHIMMVEASWHSNWLGIDHETLQFPDQFLTVEALRARWREEAPGLPRGAQERGPNSPDHGPHRHLDAGASNAACHLPRDAAP